MRTLTINAIRQNQDGSVSIGYTLTGSQSTELTLQSKADLRAWLIERETSMGDDDFFALALQAWMQATPNAVNPQLLVGRSLSIDFAALTLKAWAN